MLGATARSLQHILQPDKRLRDGRYKKKLPSIGQLEKRTSSRATNAVQL